MIGFDGDPERAAKLEAARARLLDVFPEHLAKPNAPTAFEAAELAANDHFDAILRAHKRDRSTLPIQALRLTGAAYHGFTQMPPRRLAWFVPSLVNAWLERAPGPDGPFGADDLAALAENAEWTDEEGEVLAAFFEAALDAALATPLPPPGLPVARPREDGVEVWSRRGRSVPLDVLRAAEALHVDSEPLLVRWALDPAPLAADHLLEAVFDPTVASKHYLSHEAVADRLGAEFFDATGEHQLRLSKAEATVRRNIKRREEITTSLP